MEKQESLDLLSDDEISMSAMVLLKELRDNELDNYKGQAPVRAATIRPILEQYLRSSSLTGDERKLSDVMIYVPHLEVKMRNVDAGNPDDRLMVEVSALEFMCEQLLLGRENYQ